MNVPFIPFDQAAVLLDRTSLSKTIRAADDITVFKNGACAHLELMRIRSIPDRWRRK